MKKIAILLLAVCLVLSACNATKTPLESTPQTTALAEDIVLFGGSADYVIVYPQTASLTLRELTGELAVSINAATGISPKRVADRSSKDTEAAQEILLGATNRAQSVASMEMLPAIGYRIEFIDGKLVITASHDKAMKLAVEALMGAWTASDGKLSLSSATQIHTELEESILVPTDTLPKPTAGRLSGTWTTGGTDEQVLWYNNVTLSDYEDYLVRLAKGACTTVHSYTLGENRYTLVKNRWYNAYIGYIAKAQGMRIILDRTKDVYPAPAAPTVDTVCTPALWQLELDNKTAAANGGMSYVLRLTDGSFAVIDGGYQSDADALYDLLRANTDAEKPLIRAWIITHLHNDHYGALKGITADYRDKVEINAFYYNFPGIQLGDIGPANAADIESVMHKWVGAARYSKLHSGMTFSVVDASFTVLCTYEDVYPAKLENGNDTSTVLRAEIGGQRILFLGDAYYRESAVMTDQLDASVLKSDIVQIAHHGYEGCTEALYAAVDASVALWPMPIVGFQGNAVFAEWYEGKHNSYIRTNKTVKQILVSGAGTVKLDLPYHPTGERLLDYRAFKEQS